MNIYKVIVKIDDEETLYVIQAASKIKAYSAVIEKYKLCDIQKIKLA